MATPGAHGRCMLVLSFAGTAVRATCFAKTNQEATAQSDIRTSSYACPCIHLVLSNIPLQNELCAMFCLYIALLQRVSTRTDRTRRRGIRAKYKQPIIAQSEVSFTGRHPLDLHSTTSIDTIVIAPQGRPPKISGRLRVIFSTCWLWPQVRYALRMIDIHAHADTTQCYTCDG